MKKNGCKTACVNLFCGCGGMSLGLEKVWAEVAFGRGGCRCRMAMCDEKGAYGDILAFRQK